MDLNLLAALDVLLAEESVTAAARRLGLSPSAMSRTLARLRAATGDALLVRAGRRLVPTPHAALLRARVRALTREAHAVLRPSAEPPDLAALSLSFALRASQSFMEMLSVPLLSAVAAAAPGVRLRFLPRPDRDARPLREGLADLDLGVVDDATPEMRTRLLFRDGLVGVARAGHPLLDGAPLTPARYAACGHVAATPGRRLSDPVDDALARLGLERSVRVVVPAFSDAARIARGSDLLAVVPRSGLGNPLVGEHPECRGLLPFELPFPTPAFAVSALWHPRVDADPAHRWLRDLVAATCRAAYP